MVKRLLLLLAVIALAAIARYAMLQAEEKERIREAARNAKRDDISITFKEGMRREEMARDLAQAGITGYNEFLNASDALEGTLFPDTYRFFPNTPASEVVAKLTDTFDTRTEGLTLTKDQIILASIVEREAANDTERPLIAGVYANRLKIGMKLDADPTVQYGKDQLAYQRAPSETFTFWGSITRADYQAVQSPYNTYLIAGLPPAPICNPGRKSLSAAANPATHDNLYFLHRNGELLMSKTFQEHLRKF